MLSELEAPREGHKVHIQWLTAGKSESLRTAPNPRTGEPTEQPIRDYERQVCG